MIPGHKDALSLPPHAHASIFFFYHELCPAALPQPHLDNSHRILPTTHAPALSVTNEDKTTEKI